MSITAQAFTKKTETKTSTPKWGSLPRLGLIIEKNATEKMRQDFSLLLDGISALKIQTTICDLKGWMSDAQVLPGVRVTSSADHVFYNGCDVVIFVPFTDVSEKRLNEAFLKGVVPVISAENAMAENYNPNTEAGNCFTYQGDTSWEVFAALVRASETFKFPYDWKHILKQGKKSV